MTPEKLSNLRRVMERYGLRGKAAAEAVGVSPSMISRWMRGEKYLSAHSKSARPLAEYILSGKNALSTENRVWLKRRFEESDRNIRIDWTKAGRDEILTDLINYISNDDSFRCYREDPHAAVIRSADFFTAGGMEELVNLLRWELEELPAGSVVYLYVTGDGAEMDDDFHDELADAVSRGIELRIFILPETEPDSRVLERFDGETRESFFDDLSPSIIRDSSKCVLCGRCVSACSKVQNLSVLEFVNRGVITYFNFTNCPIIYVNKNTFFHVIIYLVI